MYSRRNGSGLRARSGNSNIRNLTFVTAPRYAVAIQKASGKHVVFNVYDHEAEARSARDALRRIIPAVVEVIATRSRSIIPGTAMRRRAKR
jgi:hypothetical protein